MLRLKAERIRRELNQKQLARAAGISSSELSKIEAGRQRPYPSQVEKLAAVLELTEAQMLEDVELVIQEKAA